MDYKEAIEIIKSNYPSERYTLLREALDLAIESMQAITKLNEEYKRIDSASDIIGESFLDK